MVDTCDTNFDGRPLAAIISCIDQASYRASMGRENYMYVILRLWEAGADINAFISWASAREEADEWPYGSDAKWADEAGVKRPNVSTLSHLYDAGELYLDNPPH
jgi:hypothetical protein